MTSQLATIRASELHRLKLFAYFKARHSVTLAAPPPVGSISSNPKREGLKPTVNPSGAGGRVGSQALTSPMSLTVPTIASVLSLVAYVRRAAPAGSADARRRAATLIRCIRTTY